jgi:hypothetical protein
MKKPRSASSARAVASTKIVVAAAALSAPFWFTPARVLAQDTTKKTRAETVHLYLKYADRFIKMHETYSIAGLDDNHTIYKTARGEYFYIDPGTGDMKFLAADQFLKFGALSQKSAVPLKMIKFDRYKEATQVTLVGVDASGHVVQKNSRGEMFYLDPRTGDMVVVK